MAQLKDLIVLGDSILLGDLRVAGTIYGEPDSGGDIVENGKYSYVSGVLTAQKTKIAILIPKAGISTRTAVCNSIEAVAHLTTGDKITLTQNLIESISCTSMGVRIVFTNPNSSVGTNNTPVVAVINSCNISIV